MARELSLITGDDEVMDISAVQIEMKEIQEQINIKQGGIMYYKTLLLLQMAVSMSIILIWPT